MFHLSFHLLGSGCLLSNVNKQCSQRDMPNYLLLSQRQFEVLVMNPRTTLMNCHRNFVFVVAIYDLVHDMDAIFHPNC